MVKTARIAAVLALASFLAAVPARALSLKDWEAKSDRDQVEYLGSCFAKLVVAVGKADPPTAQKIRSYYNDKPPGVKYPAGFLDVLQQIGRVEQQAGTDRRVDLSKIEIEDIVLRNTAEKFKLPNDVLNARKSSGPGAPPPAKPPAPAKPDFQEAGVPIMVGKVDVSHIAGLKAGETPQRVVSLYGQAVTDNGIEKWYGGARLMVRYVDDVVKRVEVYSSELDRVRSRAGNDSLLDLFGQSEAAVIALLGPAKRRESQDGGTYDLFWPFAMPGKPVGQYADLSTDQTLTLEFRPGSGCFRVSVMW